MPRRDFLRRTPVPNLGISFTDFKLPGQLYSLNDQCEFTYGKGSTLCEPTPVCRALWCYNSNGDCQTSFVPWADGTPCEDDKICLRGECVQRNAADTVIDGGWGVWDQFSECSRSCGGGIQKASRECDSPIPQNGGKYCTGERVRYRSCNTHECPNGTLDFKEQQCKEFNGKHIHDSIPVTDNWEYYYEDGSCELSCRANGEIYLLKGSVIDGTPCRKNSFDICVSGICKPAGCDHILNSGTKVDVCGVCNGRNSTCKEVKEMVELVDREDGYHYVCKILAGSHHLNITLFPKTGKSHLALKVSNGAYIVNGWSIMQERTSNHEGTLIMYNGYKAPNQRISTVEAIQADMEVQLLVRDQASASVSCQYYVPL